MEGKRGERSRGARAMSWIEYHLTGPAGSLPTLQHRKTPQYGGQLLLPVWPWHGSIRDATLLLASPFPLPLPPSSPSHFLTLPQKINKKHSHHLCRVTTTSIAYHAQHRLYTAHTDTHRHLGQTHTSNMTNPHWWALCAFILTIKRVSGWVSVCLSCVCIFFFRGLILLHLHFKKKNNKCNNPATHKDSQPCTWVSMLYPVTQTCTQHYCSADAVEFHPMPASSLFTELGVALRLAGW